MQLTIKDASPFFLNRSAQPNRASFRRVINIRIGGKEYILDDPIHPALRRESLPLTFGKIGSR